MIPDQVLRGDTTQLPLVATDVAALRRAVLPSDQLTLLRRKFRLRQTTIATACGATDRTVRNWEKGLPIRQRHADRLAVLAETVLILSSTLVNDGFDQWLCARVRLLDGRRPAEVLGGDGSDEVFGAAHAFADGSYV